MISGFVTPGGTLIYGFKYTKTLQKNLRKYDNVFFNIIFANPLIYKMKVLKTMCVGLFKPWNLIFKFTN